MTTINLSKKNIYDLLKVVKAKYGDKKISAVMKIFQEDKTIVGLGLVKK
jgi:hypothetical protein